MSVTARMRVEVEVTVGVWNEASSMLELKDQIKREGRKIVINALKEVGRIVGEPQAVFLVAYEEKEGKS